LQKRNSLSRYLVTAALPYANGPVHIGHLAGCYIPADTFVRYLRFAGKDVKFICGSDEHGIPITIKARNENRTPQEIVNKYHKMMKGSFESFGISFDLYSRTSNALHHNTASQFFKKLYDKGVFIEQKSEQYYDEQEKQFLADRYISGTCPKCGNENAYGDQCENCGTALQPNELIHPKSKLSGNTPILKETVNWYLPLDQYQDALHEWLKGKKESWKSNVMGQCLSWINEGLKPRAMTRDLDWGVKVPIEGQEGKVLYVWFDAPIGYISATKELLGDDWKKYWCEPDSKLIHFIGKDNIVFHCIIFPAMLMAHEGFVLPENVPANEFLNLEGEKISTSRNWAVWLHEYLNDFSGKEDVLRYVLTATAPENKDNDFTWKDFQARNNSELVAILGNFINRVMVLSHKFSAGILPNEDFSKDTLSMQLFKDLEELSTILFEKMESYKFREAMACFMDMVRNGNKYLTETEPWKLAKSDLNKTKLILNCCLQYCANLTLLMEFLLPVTAQRCTKLLNLSIEPNTKDKRILIGKKDLLIKGTVLNPPEHLFSIIEDEVIEKQIERLKKNNSSLEAETKTNPVKNSKSMINYDDFAKLDIRIATILEAELVPKTDKLLKLKLQTGMDERTVVSGIAQSYSPENIIGKKVLLLANLEPRKIKGIESNGMILMAENENGELSFVSPEKDFINGSSVS